MHTALSPPCRQTNEREPLLRNHRFRPSSGSADKPSDQKPTHSLFWILLGLCSAVFFGALDGTIVATLITPIGSDFKQSQQASYLGTAYLLASCCFTPLYGRLSDILGRKGAMLLALSLFTSGTLFCGLAPSMNTLIAARGLAGTGGGGISTVTSIAISDLVPLKQRGMYQGFTSILFALGASLGGPLGGWINDKIGWRWAFFVQVPLLILSMILVAFHVNIPLSSEIQSWPTREKLRHIDWLGCFTLIATVGCFLLGVNMKAAEGTSWFSPRVWGLFVGSGVSLVLFVTAEMRWSAAPVMPIRLLKMRTPVAVALSSCLFSIVTFTLMYNVPLYFSAVRLTTSSEAGLHLVPNSVALVFGSLLVGWVIRRTGKTYYWMLLSVLLSVLSSVLLATWSEATSVFRLWADVAPHGLGHAGFFTSNVVALVASVPREDTAVATGMYYLSRTSGQALGVSLSGALLQAVLIRQLHARITGPQSHEIIERVRHEVASIATLDPPHRAAAIDSYATALRVVFICQASVAFCALLTCLAVEENVLPDAKDKLYEQESRREARTAQD